MTNALSDELVSILATIPAQFERTNDVILAGLQASLNTVPISGAEYRSLVSAGGAGVRVLSSPGRIAGFSIRETSGLAPALIKLHDGSDVGGELVMTIALAAGESARDWFLPGGISLAYGLFVEVVTGAIEGNAYLSPV